MNGPVSPDVSPAAPAEARPAAPTTQPAAPDTRPAGVTPPVTAPETPGRDQPTPPTEAPGGVSAPEGQAPTGQPVHPAEQPPALEIQLKDVNTAEGLVQAVDEASTATADQTPPPTTQGAEGTPKQTETPAPGQEQLTPPSAPVVDGTPSADSQSADSHSAELTAPTQESTSEMPPPPTTAQEAYKRKTPLALALAEAKGRRADIFSQLQLDPNNSDLQRAHALAEADVARLDYYRSKELLQDLLHLPQRDVAYIGGIQVDKADAQAILEAFPEGLVPKGLKDRLGKDSPDGVTPTTVTEFVRTMLNVLGNLDSRAFDGFTPPQSSEEVAALMAQNPDTKMDEQMQSFMLAFFKQIALFLLEKFGGLLGVDGQQEATSQDAAPAETTGQATAATTGEAAPAPKAPAAPASETPQASSTPAATTTTSS